MLLAVLGGGGTHHSTCVMCQVSKEASCHGPLARYVILQVAHATGMSGTFSPPPTSKETASKRSRHASRHMPDACAVMHVGIANPPWRGKRSQYSRRMRNPQFHVSGKRPMQQPAHAFCRVYYHPSRQPATHWVNFYDLLHFLCFHGECTDRPHISNSFICYCCCLGNLQGNTYNLRLM